jgi:hypothetical protein
LIVPPSDDRPTGSKPCPTCSSLSDKEYAFQKYGAEEQNTYLPAAADALQVVRDFHPLSSRKLQLRQCAACHTYYLYRTDYEYLVNGSEDEEFLSRLTAQEASEYLARLASS